MDYFDELFSPEALRLLEESGFDCGTVFQLDELQVEHESVVTPAPREAHTNQIDPYSYHPTPGCSTLDFENVAKSKRKRAKFEIKAREKVAAVRKKGACLRCRALKVPCSGSWPCKSCTYNKISCHGRESKHKWMDCVPHYLKDLDIYALDFPCSQEQYDSILRTDDITLVGNARQTFDPEIHWNLGNITADCAEWLLEERMKPGSNSRVWMLSSLKAECLLSTFLDGNLCKALRVLVETSSILHNWGMDTSYSRYSSTDLWSIRSFAGSQVLRGLERALNLQRLANASADVLKALFLVLLGTVIAVGYSTSESHLDERIESSRMTANTFGEAQKQLLRILAHHMILIAERSHVLESQRANGHILENASRLWSGKAVFDWEIVRVDGPREPEEDFEDFTSGSSIKKTQRVTSIDFSGQSSTLDFEDVPTSPNLFSDTVSPENTFQFSELPVPPTAYLMHGHCIRCHEYITLKFHSADLEQVVCERCLPHNAATLSLSGDPLPGLMVPEMGTSAVADSTPYLEDEWNWSNPPFFPAEDNTSQMSQPSTFGQGRMCTSSSKAGLADLATSDSNYSRRQNVSGVHNFGCKGCLEPLCLYKGPRSKLGETDEATHIGLPAGSNSINHAGCLEAPRRRHGVTAFTKWMFRKLLL